MGHADMWTMPWYSSVNRVKRYSTTAAVACGSLVMPYHGSVCMQAKAHRSTVLHSLTPRCPALPCAAKQSKAKRSEAKQSKAKRSEAKQSKAKQSKAKRSKRSNAKLSKLSSVKQLQGTAGQRPNICRSIPNTFLFFFTSSDTRPALAGSIRHGLGEKREPR
jgi:hypothetical protein